MTNLQLRVITALIYFPLLLLSVYEENIFTLFMLVLLIGALHEYFSFLQKPSSRSQWIAQINWIFLGTLPFLGLMFNLNLALGFLLLGIFYQAYFVKGMIEKKTFSELLKTSTDRLFGYLFITGLFSTLILIRKGPGGAELIWFLLLVVGATDSAAYFVGKKWGRSPFFNWISPSKTMEGALGGLAGAILVALLFHSILSWNQFSVPPLLLTLVLGLMVGASSIFGDLMVSLIKRNYQVKDSGKLFLGHGGVLDRFDGVLFAGLPLLVIVLVWKSIA
jgi:phosphatidate cytidylyltransferase